MYKKKLQQKNLLPKTSIPFYKFQFLDNISKCIASHSPHHAIPIYPTYNNKKTNNYHT